MAHPGGETAHSGGATATHIPHSQIPNAPRNLKRVHQVLGVMTTELVSQQLHRILVKTDIDINVLGQDDLAEELGGPLVNNTFGRLLAAVAKRFVVPTSMITEQHSTRPSPKSNAQRLKNQLQFGNGKFDLIS